MPFKNNDETNPEHFLGEQIERVITETRQLHGRFKMLISRFSAELARDMHSSSRENLIFNSRFSGAEFDILGNRSESASKFQPISA